MRTLFFLLVIGSALSAQQTAQLDASRSLFTVMTALNLTGYNAGLDSPNGSPVRQMVRERLKGKVLPSIVDLKTFFARNRKADPALDASQYVSFALSVKEPPTFESKFKLDEPLPPDVEPLTGFSELLSRFYQEADLESLWNEAAPWYEQELLRYREGVVRSLREVDGYVRHVQTATSRRFVVYVELMGAPNQIFVRSYRDEVLMVVTPAPEPRIAEVQSAYLSFLLDPLSFRYKDKIQRLRGLKDYAEGAPLLDPAYREDFALLAVKSLVRAIESRLARPRSQGPALVQEALSEGFVLTPAFAELLPQYEKQEVALRLFLGDLLDAVDLKKEEKRFESVEFASERRTKTVKPPVAPVETLSPEEAALERAEKALRGSDVGSARAALEEALQLPERNHSHAKAYYGLARAAFFERQDPNTVEGLFQKVLTMNPDAATRAWTFLHLGLVKRALGEKPGAIEWLRRARSADGAPDALKDRATAELRKLGAE
jgi:tetratricopeptide (TPR) repeat protein